MYTLGQAAKATGKSKTAIARAIGKGKISADKDANNHWRIDPSELHRIYPVVSQDNGMSDVNDARGHTPDHTGLQHRIELLEVQLAAAKAQVEDLRSDRDAWREQAQRKLLSWRGLFGGGKVE